MCRQCIREMKPDRGNICVESGYYYLNFIGCAKCSARSLKAANKQEENEEVNEDVINNHNNDDNKKEVANQFIETITYDHVCEKCDHVVANHFYRFEAHSDTTQEYLMECYLCGGGIHQVAKLSSADPAKLHPGVNYDELFEADRRQLLEPINDKQLTNIVNLTAINIPIPNKRDNNEDDENDDEEWL